MRFVTNLAAVMVRPRATMARILETPGPRAVVLLFALAAVSGMVGDLDAPSVGPVVQQTGGAPVAWLVAGIVICLLVAFVALSWFYAWVPYFAGRFLGGTGDVRGVRAALAWGLAPSIWALLYRVPAAIWLAPAAATAVHMKNGNVAFDPGRLADSCGIALVFVLVELAVLVWCAVVMSNTVAEAHRFSAWHGLGTLAISAIAPVVVLLAAVLAIR